MDASSSTDLNEAAHSSTAERNTSSGTPKGPRMSRRQSRSCSVEDVQPIHVPTPVSALHRTSIAHFQRLLASTRDAALLQLDLGRFFQWVLCFCIVDFNLDTGQTVETLYPPIELSLLDKTTMYCLLIKCILGISGFKFCQSCGRYRLFIQDEEQ